MAGQGRDRPRAGEKQDEVKDPCRTGTGHETIGMPDGCLDGRLCDSGSRFFRQKVKLSCHGLQAFLQ